MESILVTGGAGFIGSHFLHMFLSNKPNATVINVDALTYAGCYDTIEDLNRYPGYVFVHDSINNKEKMMALFDTYGIDTVVNFAAETHVDRSINQSDVFFQTNVMGTQTLLDVAMANWKVKTDDFNDRRFKSGVTFLQISTDEVYGSLGTEGFFNESTPLHPNSPYAASKAAADMIVNAYHHTYGLPTNITRCSNNYGPNQYPEKLIPLMIKRALANQPLPLYGDGKQIRDWLHVTDHCEAVMRVLLYAPPGEIYNIGGHNEHTNLDIVHLILDTLGKDDHLIQFIKDRPGHDRRYAIDPTKMVNELGWEPTVLFEEGIKDTVLSYINTVHTR